MKVRGSFVSLSCILPHPPEDKKKKKVTRTAPQLLEHMHRYRYFSAFSVSIMLQTNSTTLRLRSVLSACSRRCSVNRTDRSGIDVRISTHCDWSYDSPPQKPAIFFNERFMAAGHEERYHKRNMFTCLLVNKMTSGWQAVPYFRQNGGEFQSNSSHPPPPQSPSTPLTDAEIVAVRVGHDLMLTKQTANLCLPPPPLNRAEIDRRLRIPRTTHDATPPDRAQNLPRPKETFDKQTHQCLCRPRLPPPPSLTGWFVVQKSIPRRSPFRACSTRTTSRSTSSATQKRPTQGVAASPTLTMKTSSSCTTSTYA